MTEERERIVAALERGEATAQQQKEAAQIMRDQDRELREIEEWDERE